MLISVVGSRGRQRRKFSAGGDLPGLHGPRGGLMTIAMATKSETLVQNKETPSFSGVRRGVRSSSSRYYVQGEPQTEESQCYAHTPAESHAALEVDVI